MPSPSSNHPADAPNRSIAPSIAISIGNFDAVHLGHQRLIERARSHAGQTGRVIILAFHPHPMEVLSPDNAHQTIESFQIRKQRLLQAGADEVVELKPTPEFLSKEPDQFLDDLIEQYHPSIIVEGHDFHFGKRRTGTPQLLEKLCQDRGIQTDILGPVQTTLTDQSVIPASSSLTRWLITNGRIRDAAFVLGRPHELVGTVVQGQQLGRTINIPTINLDTDSLLPADGVYSGFARFTHNNREHRILAAINIGSRPTVQGLTRRAEAHLLNPDSTPWTPAPDMPDYNWSCSLELIGWVRDQVKFGSLDTLKQQIRRDCDRICEIQC
jgi:riboflavin kinase / FMN adenylyltransferase